MRLFLVLLFILIPSMSYAEDTQVEETETETPSFYSDENPFLKEIERQAIDFAETFTKPQAEAMAGFREGFGMIRAVQKVARNVEEAVGLCGEENPDLKDDMDTRFQVWKEAVEPVTKGHEETMGEAIKSWNFPDSDSVISYFKLIDDAAEYMESKTERHVLTGEKDCKALLKSMDRTQDTLVDLLSEITWPVSGEEEEKTEEESVEENEEEPEEE